MHDPYEFDFVAVDEHADTIVANTNSIEPVNSADLLEIADFCRPGCCFDLFDYLLHAFQYALILDLLQISREALAEGGLHR